MFFSSDGLIRVHSKANFNTKPGTQLSRVVRGREEDPFSASMCRLTPTSRPVTSYVFPPEVWSSGNTFAYSMSCIICTGNAFSSSPHLILVVPHCVAVPLHISTCLMICAKQG